MNEQAQSRFSRFLLGAAILFWGWQNQALVFAVPMALLYEMAPSFKWRWAFDSSDFNRLVDLTAVLFVATAVYQFDARALHGVYGILQWLPALLYVLLIGQRYSVRGRIGLGSLFLSIRRALARGDIAREDSVDFSFPYFGSCLLSGVAGVVRGEWLIPAFVALLVVGLAHARSKRHSRIIWTGVVCLAVLLGYAGQWGIKATRQAMEPFIMELLREYMVSRQDPFRTQTAIGEIGRIKTSQRIEMRVDPDSDGNVPDLLTQGVYRVYIHGSWLIGRQSMDVLRPTDGGLTWTFGPEPPVASRRALTMTRFLNRGRGVLAMPPGSWQLRNLGVETLEQYGYGAMRIKRGPDLVQYQVRFDPAQQTQPEPDLIDLRLPSAYRDTFESLAKDLGRDMLSERERVDAITRYFATGFSYSLEGAGGQDELPLKRFMEVSRAGHCEYFATATVLALRAAGIPARYATGYAVQEWGELEKAYVVRRRHAHAWALAYVDGAWEVVDTTPASWLPLESANPPWWINGYDLWQWLSHMYSKWRWRLDSEDDFPWVVLIVLPLVAVLIWRLRGQRVEADADIAPVPVACPGEDSPLLAITAMYSKRNLGPNAAEPLSAWHRRMLAQGHFSDDAGLFAEALSLHERLRFDPDGLDATQVIRLTDLCDQWRAKHLD